MASDGLRSLRGDPFLAQFAAEEGFDVQRFVSAVVNDIDPALAKVQRGVERVNEQLRAEVEQHESSLLLQSAHIAMLEDAVRTAKEGVARIARAADSVGAAIRVPLATLSDATAELDRTQRVCEAMRRVLRFVSLHHRLDKHLEQSNLPAAARALADLASLENDPLLAQVEVVHALLPGLDATRSSLRTRASNLLMEGMQSQSQQDVSNALLVFAAMGALRDKVKTAVSVTTNRSRRAVDAGVGAVADASSELCWQALEATLTELQSHCVSVAHLQGLLLRTKDPLTGTVLWETFQLQDEALAERTVTAASRRALHKNYPRLWSTLRDFVRRVVFSYEMMQLAPGFRVAESTALELLVSPLSSIEAIHIDRAKRRLTKAADALFPTPDDERTAELCRVMVRETTDARDVCSVRVAALVVDLCMRVTAEAVQQAEKHPVASLTTQTQAHAALAALVNALRLLEGCLESLLLTDDLDPLRASVVTCQAAQRAILSPLRAALERDGPQSASVFKSAVLPLFQPSPLLLATLFGSK